MKSEKSAKFISLENMVPQRIALTPGPEWVVQANEQNLNLIHIAARFFRILFNLYAKAQ